MNVVNNNNFTELSSGQILPAGQTIQHEITTQNGISSNQVWPQNGVISTPPIFTTYVSANSSSNSMNSSYMNYAIHQQQTSEQHTYNAFQGYSTNFQHNLTWPSPGLYTPQGWSTMSNEIPAFPPKQSNFPLPQMNEHIGVFPQSNNDIPIFFPEQRLAQHKNSPNELQCQVCGDVSAGYHCGGMLIICTSIFWMNITMKEYHFKFCL